MVLNSNFHSHCIFCDGRSHPEKFIKFALANHFRAYGFSSHSPLPFETFWNMSKEDTPEYIAEIQRLKVKYSDFIEIYLGMEIDYLSETYNATLPYFRDLPLDYRISSIHFMPWQTPLLEDNMVCIDGSYDGFKDGINEHYNGSIRALTEDFFRHSMKMVELGGFDIVGHIDKVYMNGSKHPDFNINAEWFRKPFLELLDLIAEKGLIVEINTKNFLRRNETYPHLSSYKELKTRNIPIMVNSDCHYPDLVNDGRKETILLLREAGFRSTREIVKGQWQDIALCGDVARPVSTITS
ncbi:MAG: histidinol-phosphatase [Tannerella sp.]|jgi:histidinol-phosphatase (PHP family)|nr:histidinol-phosphatase [Tannerella sp.]